MNEEHFEPIYRKFYARVWRYFRANNISDDESHDLAQEVFRHLLEGVDKVRNDDAWPLLVTIARRILLNRVRSYSTQKRSATLVSFDDPDFVLREPAAPPDPDYIERQAAEERQQRLQAAMASLPRGQRDCFLLWYDGNKYGGIAKILSISMDAVKSRLRDAKRTLRQQLGEPS